MLKFTKKTIFAAALLGLTSFAQAGIISLTGTGGVVDDSTANRSVTVNVTDIQGYVDSILDINLTVDYSKCSLTQNANGCEGEGGSTFNREIVFDLLHASVNVDIVNARTFSGQNTSTRVTQVFDDEASTLVGGNTLLNGLFQPVGNLSAFDGLSALGLWTFTFQDIARGDGLVVHSWTIDIELAEVSAPATVALLGLGIFGLGLVRRKK
jgi:hypothetical protein